MTAQFHSNAGRGPNHGPFQPGAELAAFAALVGGAVVLGISPVFVRIADVGPFASAFWRVALALPLLAAWARLEVANGVAPRRRGLGAVALAGVFFAGDLMFWHLAILHTSVANATLLATLAPVWVAAGSMLFLREPIARQGVLGLGLCLVGAFLLVRASALLNPDRLLGDLYGFITSAFFGGYILAARAARRLMGPGVLMLRSSLATAPLLLVAALAAGDPVLPSSASGWATLAALGLGTHAVGQGLVAVALGRLPAAFTALVIFLEALTAAVAGWMLLAEPIVAAQALGAVAILAGIWVARPRPVAHTDPPASGK